MNKKSYLEAPQAELIVVRFEENILSFTPSGYEKLEIDEEDDL